MHEKANSASLAEASAVFRPAIDEAAHAVGRYHVECRGPDGELKWVDDIENVVCTEGKNVMLDAALAGSSYTVVGPFMGLISSVSYTAVAATDVGTQINGTNGWKEAGGTNAPTYTSPRPTVAWSAASAGAKAPTGAISFAITGTGTVKGCFLLFGTGAVSTLDDAHGKIWSVGVFSNGDKVVGNGDTIAATYSTSL